jgi:putative hydrolase of the HAD superfamily
MVKLMIRSVMFDFGGVITTSPFTAFRRYERENGLPEGFIQKVNSTNADTNAWARLERGEIDLHGFADTFQSEASVLGHRVDGLAIIALLNGEVRPDMVEALRRCSDRFKTACLTNNFTVGDSSASPEMAQILLMFDFVLESRTAGIRKPDPRFYQIACEALDVAPDEVVYLDDLGINLKPARSMGMHTIKVTDHRRALAELAEVTGLSLD